MRFAGIAFALAAATPAYANDFLFSHAAAPVIAPLLAVWLLAGMAVRFRRRDLVFCGWGAVIAFAIAGAFYLHLEVLIWMWLIYLAILVAHFLVSKSVTRATRRLNLVFHGSFVLLAIVGGGVAKIVYWRANGGFARWSAWSGELYAPFLAGAAILAVVVYFASARALRTPAPER
jgi:hypothetical protein